MSSSSRSKLSTHRLALLDDTNRKHFTKICTTVSASDCDSMARKAAAAFDLKTDLVELRIDHLRNPSIERISRSLSRFFRRAVVTVRPKEQGGRFQKGEAERIELMLKLARMEPAYVDVELSTLRANARLRESLRKEKTIVSWHNFRGTPSARELRRRLADSRHLGGIPKIVTFARGLEDNMRVLSLYVGSPKDLVAFCMGQQGILSRVATLTLSPLAYASLPGDPAAPGQLEVSSMREIRGLISDD